LQELSDDFTEYTPWRLFLTRHPGKDKRIWQFDKFLEPCLFLRACVRIVLLKVAPEEEIQFPHSPSATPLQPGQILHACRLFDPDPLF